MKLSKIILTMSLFFPASQLCSMAGIDYSPQGAAHAKEIAAEKAQRAALKFHRAGGSDTSLFVLGACAGISAGLVYAKTRQASLLRKSVEFSKNLALDTARAKKIAEGELFVPTTKADVSLIQRLMGKSTSLVGPKAAQEHCLKMSEKRKDLVLDHAFYFGFFAPVVGASIGCFSGAVAAEQFNRVVKEKEELDQHIQQLMRQTRRR